MPGAALYAPTYEYIDSTQWEEEWQTPLLKCKYFHSGWVCCKHIHSV